MPPHHFTFGAEAVKSRPIKSGNGTARLSGLVKFLRRLRRRPASPSAAISSATVRLVTFQPRRRSSAHTRGEP